MRYVLTAAAAPQGGSVTALRLSTCCFFDQELGHHQNWKLLLLKYQCLRIGSGDNETAQGFSGSTCVSGLCVCKPGPILVLDDQDGKIELGTCRW
jgi:hypothetical protein